VLGFVVLSVVNPEKSQNMMTEVKEM